MFSQFLLRFIMFGSFCLMSASEENIICLKVAKNEAYDPAFKPLPGFCEGWSCWQSQLTLANKAKITQIMNDFRNQEAKNMSNMMELTWHWALEQEAIRAAASCRRQYLEKYEFRRNIEGLGFSLLCENGCMNEAIRQNPSQVVFIAVLSFLLKQNKLQDYDETGKFRRRAATYFGCSLVVRSAISKAGWEDIYNFVCVYCTLEPDMMSEYRQSPEVGSNCPVFTELGGNPKYSNLCHAKSRPNIFICPRNDLCDSKEEKPLLWQAAHLGGMTEMIITETNTGPILIINHTQFKDLDPSGKPSMVSSSHAINTGGKYLELLSYYPPVPKHVYKYSPLEIQFYDKVMKESYDQNIGVIGPIILEPAHIFQPGDATVGYEDAWCCTAVFLFSCIPTIVLGIIIYYTWKHS